METLLLEAENFKKGGGWFLLYLLFVKNLKTILAFQLFKDAPLVKDILCLFPLSHFFFALHVATASWVSISVRQEKSLAIVC